MPPRWLKPVEQISSNYSSITFAISDPDGSTTNKLLQGRTALFGKEVTIEKWVDKPTLVQCSRCHALGHTCASKACPLSANSVKCFICGAAHKSEEHNQKCPRKHTVAGVCDCKHYKCLNCQGSGHHCRETKCPARSLFRSNATRRKKNKGKGKERANDQTQPRDNQELNDETSVLPEDPFSQLNYHPRRTEPVPDWLNNPPEDPTGSPSMPAPNTDTEPQPMDYSPSHPQGSATPATSQ